MSATPCRDPWVGHLWILSPSPTSPQFPFRNHLSPPGVVLEGDNTKEAESFFPALGVARRLEHIIIAADTPGTTDGGLDIK